MTFFQLDDVNKGYGSGPKRTEVLRGIDLRIDEGEFVAVVGFSGSGKTTLISLMAGLAEPDRGTISLAGRPIRGPGPDRGVVFQNYSLLPWLSVYGNIELAVKQVFPHFSKARRRQHVEWYVGMVNLTAALQKRPHELSGGMRQRVSVARALAMQPQILLMDEPFSALDALTRATLQDELTRIWQQEQRTVVMITNDVDEAILLADRIIPLSPGPAASLGPAFNVCLPRPRDRAAINHNAEFKLLRNKIANHLLSVSTQSKRRVVRPTVTRPDIRPIAIPAA